MSCRAPLPKSAHVSHNDHSALFPVPPPLDDAVLNRHKRDRFYINNKQASHGKQWIASCLSKTGLIEVNTLPHPKCVFFWIPREYAYFAHELFTGNEVKPCIGFIPSQHVLGEKSKFARTLHDYYGSDAWKYITPLTYDCKYDEVSGKFIVPKRIQQLIESKPANHVWITKSSFGSSGSRVYLYRGNTLRSFEEFIAAKFKPQTWGQRFEKHEWLNISHIELKSIIIQQYIDRPLLFNDKYKFDLRVYGLVATSNPCVLFFHIGKMRVCGVEYNDISKMNDEETTQMLLHDDDRLFGHISNSKIQRDHLNYDHRNASIDGQTMLNDWDAFIRFMYDVAVQRKQFKNEWFETYQYDIDSMTLKDMKELINTKCCRLFSELYSSCKHLFDKDAISYNRECQFTFQGNDIIIDEEGKFWLIEVNRVPSLSLIGYQSIKEMTKNMLKEAIDICLEIRELKLKNITVDQTTPLKSVHYWIKCKLDYKKSAVDKVQEMIHAIDTLLV